MARLSSANGRDCAAETSSVLKLFDSIFSPWPFRPCAVSLVFSQGSAASNGEALPILGGCYAQVVHEGPPKRALVTESRSRGHIFERARRFLELATCFVKPQL